MYRDDGAARIEAESSKVNVARDVGDTVTKTTDVVNRAETWQKTPAGKWDGVQRRIDAKLWKDLKKSSKICLDAKSAGRGMSLN